MKSSKTQDTQEEQKKAKRSEGEREREKERTLNRAHMKRMQLML